MGSILERLGAPFGVLAGGNTSLLKVVAKNEDVAVGDLFILPSHRGRERYYIFRTTEYANVMNYTIDMDDVARAKLTMPDAYLAEDTEGEKLLELTGILLGYAERRGEGWAFVRPRRLPDHLTYVYRVGPENAEVVRELMADQLGTDGLYVGDLLAGERALEGAKVFIPASAISHHIGIFGRTGCGKSNLMMVLIDSMFRHNRNTKGQRVSMLAIDPHDEFCLWPSGRRRGITEIVESYTDDERRELVEPFYYLTAKDIGDTGLRRRLWLSRADVVPEDLFSITEFTEQQMAFANYFYSVHGERWISRLLMGGAQVESYPVVAGADHPQFLPTTVSAVERRLSPLRRGQTNIFTPFDPEVGEEYRSVLPELVWALEAGRIITVDTTLMSEFEQYLLTTIVARTLFSLRKALRSARSAAELPREIYAALGCDPERGTTGVRTFAEHIVGLLGEEAPPGRRLPYIKENGELARIEELPAVNIVIEEAPNLLSPERLRFGSIFREIARQGRKFGIGLTVISQQVSAIDQSVLTQINTEFTLALGNESERREAIRNASTDLHGFEKELQVLAKGQAILTASYRDVPLPVQVPLFDMLP